MFKLSWSNPSALDYWTAANTLWCLCCGLCLCLEFNICNQHSVTIDNCKDGMSTGRGVCSIWFPSASWTTTKSLKLLCTNTIYLFFSYVSGCSFLNHLVIARISTRASPCINVLCASHGGANVHVYSGRVLNWHLQPHGNVVMCNDLTFEKNR